MKRTGSRAARASAAAATWLAVAVLASGDRTYAADAATRRAQVAVRIGPRAISVGAIEDGLAQLSPHERLALGRSPAAVARAYVASAVVPGELLSLGAAADKLRDGPAAAYRIEWALSSATIRAIAARLPPASDIPMDEVRRYFDENRERYETPERYRVWRILCKTREEAQSVLDAARRDPAPATFAALAREHSLDKGTYLRAGDLGFLTADGLSKEPGLRVDPAVVDAARSVRDGEIVPAPVVEGQYFSVVWRRTTRPAVRRSPDEMASEIRETLWNARVKRGTDELVAQLRAARLRDYDPSSLAALDLPDPR